MRFVKTKEDGWKLWQRGQPMWRAFVAFGPEDKVRKFKRLDLLRRRPPKIPDLPDDMPFADRLGTMAERLGRLQNLIAPIEKELQTLCIARVSKSELVALGFAVPRRPGDSPVEVPRDLWGCNIDWERSLIEGNGLRVEAIRLVPSNLHQTQSTKGGGRPSRQQDIEVAFLALRASGAINRDSGLKAAANLIREHIRNANRAAFSMKGLSDNSIAEHVNRLWSASSKK